MKEGERRGEETIMEYISVLSTDQEIDTHNKENVTFDWNRTYISWFNLGNAYQAQHDLPLNYKKPLQQNKFNYSTYELQLSRSIDLQYLQILFS